MRKAIQSLQAEMLLVGLAVASVVTWPLVLHLGHRLPGSAFVGAYSHTWKYWWTARALLDLHQNPAYTDLVNYPAGLAVGYYMASFLEAIWVLPVTRLFGPVAGVSVFTIGTMTTAFWAATVLARWCGLSRTTAALAALAWTFSPHYLGFLVGGSPENLATPWIPLCLLASLALVGLPSAAGSLDPRAGTLARWRSPGHRVLAAAGVAVTLLLQALTTWYGGLLLGVVAGCVLLVGAWARRRDGPMGAVALLLGLLVGSAAVIVSAHSLLPLVANPLAQNVHHPVSADLSWLWMAWKRDQPETVLYTSNTLWLNNHLILSLAALSLLGGLRRGGRFWLVASIPFVLDLLVPQTWIGRLSIPSGGGRSLPSLVMAMLVMHAERRLGMFHLFLALSAGHGLVWLADAVRRRRGSGLATAVMALPFVAWGTESMLLGPVRLPIASFEADKPSHCAYLADQGEGAVIDLPLRVRQGSRGQPSMDGHRVEAVTKAVRSRYLYEQTLHGLPVLAAVGTRLSNGLEDLPIQDPLLTGLAIAGSNSRNHGLAVSPGWTPDRLTQAGFRWIVLHQDLAEPALAADLAADLQRLLGEPLAFGSALVFRFPDAFPVPAAAPPSGADESVHVAETPTGR